MHRIVLMLVPCLIILGYAGCGEKRVTKSASSRMTLAVIPKGTTHEFWKAVHAGARLFQPPGIQAFCHLCPMGPGF